MQVHELSESQRGELAIGLLKADVHSLEVAQKRLVEGVGEEYEYKPAGESGKTLAALETGAMNPQLPFEGGIRTPTRSRKPGRSRVNDG